MSETPIETNFYKNLLETRKETPEKKTELDRVRRLPLEQQLEYAKNLIEIGVEMAIQNKQDPANLFRGAGSGYFPVAVIQEILHGQGYPSQEFMSKIATDMVEIQKKYNDYQLGSEWQEQIQKINSEAKSHEPPFNSKEEEANYETNQQTVYLERKLHELSVDFKKQFIAESEKHLKSVQSVFEPIREKIGGDQTARQNYMMVIFAGFSTLPIGKDLKTQAGMTEEAGKLFAQQFRTGAHLSAVAMENRELLSNLQTGLLVAPEQPMVKHKPLLASEIATNPIYFDSVPYLKIKEYCQSPAVNVIESLDFIRAAKDFQHFSGAQKEEQFEKLKEMINRKDDPSPFMVEGPVALNLSGSNRGALIEMMDEKPFNEQAFTQKLNATIKTDIMAGFTEKLDKISLEKLNVVPIESQPQIQTKQSQNNKTMTEDSTWRRLGRAVVEFFRSGLSFEAAKKAYEVRTPVQRPIAQTEPLLVVSPKTPTPINAELQNSLNGLMGQVSNNQSLDSTEVLNQHSGPPYTPTIKAEAQPESLDKIKTNLRHYLNNFESKGKELDYIRQQTGQAALNIVMGSEPKDVIKNVELAIEVAKEFGIKEPESIKSLESLEKKLVEFKSRIDNAEVKSAESKQVSAPVIPKHSI